MAGELRIKCDFTGVNVYALLLDRTSQVWDLTETDFVAYATADIGDYDVALTEQGTASARYAANFPSDVPAGYYDVEYYLRGGGSPAESDVLLGSEQGYWDGTSWTPVSVKMDLVDDSITEDTISAGGVNLIQGGLATSTALQTVDDNVDTLVSANGYGPVILRTTIDSLSDQQNFTLAAGSADDDAYNGLSIIITDQATAAQKHVDSISDYTGSTKAVVLTGTPVFTIASGDLVTIIAGGSSGGGGATQNITATQQVIRVSN